MLFKTVLSQGENPCDALELDMVCYFEVQESQILNDTLRINAILENPFVRVINPYVLWDVDLISMCEASVHKFTLSGFTLIKGENTYWDISSEGNKITTSMLLKMMDENTHSIFLTSVCYSNSKGGISVAPKRGFVLKHQ